MEIGTEKPAIVVEPLESPFEPAPARTDPAPDPREPQREPLVEPEKVPA